MSNFIEILKYYYIDILMQYVLIYLTMQTDGKHLFYRKHRRIMDMMQRSATKETYFSPIGIGALFFKDCGFYVSFNSFPICFEYCYWQ